MNNTPVCILPHGFGSCLGSLKSYHSGVACCAVIGIGVSVKPVCLHLSSCPSSSNSVGGLRTPTPLDVVTMAVSVTLLTIVASRPLLYCVPVCQRTIWPFKPAACRCVRLCVQPISVGRLLSLHKPLQLAFLNHSVNLVLRIGPPRTLLFTVRPSH